MSLYADYIEEYQGVKTIENERGFITYMVYPESKEIMVHDFYVKPEHRTSKTALKLAEEVMAIGKKEGCTHLSAINNTDPNDKERVTYIMRLHLHWGMEIVTAKEGQIIMAKEIN